MRRKLAASSDVGGRFDLSCVSFSIATRSFFFLLSDAFFLIDGTSSLLLRVVEEEGEVMFVVVLPAVEEAVAGEPAVPGLIRRASFE